MKEKRPRSMRGRGEDLARCGGNSPPDQAGSHLSDYERSEFRRVVSVVVAARFR